MKKIGLSISTFMVFLFIISCSNPVQEELLNYINNELPKISELENKVVTDYASVTGDNYKDDYTTYTTIKDNIIPTYKKYIEDLEKISKLLKTTEVRNLHESCIEASNTTYSGLVLLLSALENRDYSQISQANEKIDKGRKLIREWETELQILCKKNNVVIKNKNS